MTDGTHPAFTDGSHVYIGGVTGSGDEFGGKTGVANWWLVTAVEAGHFDYGLAFDPKGRKYDGATVTDAREAAAAIGDGEQLLDWTIDGSPTDMDNIEDRHAEAVEFAHGLNGSVIIAHDDAVLYAGSDALKWCTALAGNPGPGGDRIKSLVVSQDPWDLPRSGVRANLTAFVWVGPVTDDARRYFEVMNREAAAAIVADAHDREGPHSWSLIDGDDVTTFEPVAERYVK